METDLTDAVGELTLAASVLREATDHRNRLIRQARADGWSYRQIAAAANLSAPGVEAICKRAEC